jgi:hypothetical protein
MQRVVGAGLVGDHIRAHAAFHHLRHDIGGVAAQGDRDSPAFGGVFLIRASASSSDVACSST